jgi:hypothetical protein
MSICGVDGGIAPIAPGPLSSIKDTIKYDLSVIIIETKIFSEKKENSKAKNITSKSTYSNKNLPQTIQIHQYIHPITREQMIEII